MKINKKQNNIQYQIQFNEISHLCRYVKRCVQFISQVKKIEAEEEEEIEKIQWKKIWRENWKFERNERRKKNCVLSLNNNWFTFIILYVKVVIYIDAKIAKYQVKDSA